MGSTERTFDLDDILGPVDVLQRSGASDIVEDILGGGVATEEINPEGGDLDDLSNEDYYDEQDLEEYEEETFEEAVEDLFDHMLD